MMMSHQAVGASVFISRYWVSREPCQERTPSHVTSCCPNLFTCSLGKVKRGGLGLRVRSCLSKHSPVSLGGWRASPAAEQEETQLKLSLICILLPTILLWGNVSPERRKLQSL